MESFVSRNLKQKVSFPEFRNISIFLSRPNYNPEASRQYTEWVGRMGELEPVL